MITIIAFITMFIDHLWFIFFPWEDILRIIWRIAFPLFAWMIVRGFYYTKNINNYMKRLLILAIISQIPMFFIAPWLFNVVFTLIFWLFAIILYKNEKLHLFFKITIIWLLAYIAEYFHFDYWAYWVFTIFLFYLFWQKKIILLYFSLLTLLFYWIKFNYENLNFIFTFHLQFYSIFAILLVYFTPLQKYDFKINKTFKYLFYPVHLRILYIIYLIIHYNIFNHLFL